MKQKRKLISIVLTLVLILGTTNVSSFAMVDEELIMNEAMFEELFDLDHRGDLEDEGGLWTTDDEGQETAEETNPKADDLDGGESLEDKEELFTLDDETLEAADAMEENLSKPTFIAAGGDNSFCVKEDKSVWGWGRGLFGCLGTGTTSTSYTPVEIPIKDISVISNRGYHVLALKEDGTVWSWGHNYYGQLGIGDAFESYVPVNVSSLSKIIKITAGETHSLALGENGTVWSWGNNSYGQLGIGNTSDKRVPVNISSLNDIVDIKAGVDHSLALKRDGTVWAWGLNWSGELGDGTRTNRSLPVQVNGLSNITAISLGSQYSLALKNDGTVWAWGINNYGQLGDGKTTASTTPVQVELLTGVVAISAGEGHNLALKNDRTVWVWGKNDKGQLGDGTTVNRMVPIKVMGLSGVQEISANSNHNLALRKDGKVFAWGDNSFGQLGDGTSTTSYSPIKSMIGSESPDTFRASYITFENDEYEIRIPKKDKVSVLIHANVYDEEDDEIFGEIFYSLDRTYVGVSMSQSTGTLTVTTEAKASTITIYARHGDLERTVNLNLKEGKAPHTMIQAGNRDSFYNEYNSIWGWGYGQYGVLGIGTSLVMRNPVEIPITNIWKMSVKSDHFLALKENGTVWSWGRNDYGQLGTGNTSNCNVPVAIASLDGILEVAAGDRHSLALKEDGTMWAWGCNNQGQLGVGNTINSNVPVNIPSLNNVIGVAAGQYHSLALKEDGTVWSWGDNSIGQLGDGTAIRSLAPIQVSDLSDIIAISTGDGYSLALRRDGTVWSWGDNYFGQLGDGTTVRNRAMPTQVNELTGIVAISAGSSHSLALKEDGTVWSWGQNSEGKLGDGTKTNRNKAMKIAGLSEIIEISAGSNRNLVLKSNGEIWSWGDNTCWQLGDGTTSESYVPIKSLIKIKLFPIGETSYLTFEQEEYEAFIPGEGVLSLPIKANTYDINGYEKFDEIKYSPNTAYVGVSVDVDTGVVTITDEAEEGIVVIHGAFKDFNKTTNIVLRKGARVPAYSSIEAGNNNSFHVREDKSVWGWGRNDYDTLGTGMTNIKYDPVEVQIQSISMLSNNGSHTLAIKDNGTLWSWGRNNSGQLGIGTLADSKTPVNVPNLNGMVKVAAGYGHSLALRGDGTVWAWGDNQWGQVGVENTLIIKNPTKLENMSEIVDIAAGSYHNLALKEDGTVWAWGSNSSGALGDGTTTQRSMPIQVMNLTNVIAISAGPACSIALKEDGTIWTWGLNNYGQLGDGTTSERKTPVQVDGLTDIKQISAGNGHNLALKADKTVWSWGYNRDGQVGNGTIIYTVATPSQVVGLHNVKEISAGANHNLALKNTGEVWSWGANNYGQLGDGTEISSNIAIRSLITSKSPGTASYITFENEEYDAFLPNEDEISIVVAKAKIYDDDDDEILDEIIYSLEGAPVGVSIDSDTGIVTVTNHAKIGKITIRAAYDDVEKLVSLTIKKGLLKGSHSVIEAGSNNSYYIKRDRSTWGWGEDGGRLGTGTSYVKYNPVEISITNLSMISNKNSHTLAVKKDGTIWSWGSNNYGQLGIGYTASSDIPINISSLSGVVKAAVGGSHSLALRKDGTVWVWGNNSYGQLGTGNTLNNNLPVNISKLSGVVDISAGIDHSLALKGDGTVWAWGYNKSGELGDGTRIQHTSPIQVKGLTDVTAISAGASFSVGLKRDGTVWAWGDNDYGQLGDNSRNRSMAPVQVKGLTDIIAISSGTEHSLALKGDGTVWAWGLNSYGRLGVGTKDLYLLEAEKVVGLAGVKEISAGANHCLTVKKNGEIWVWGGNVKGQLGDNTTTDSNVPVRSLIEPEAPELPIASFIKFESGKYQGFIPREGSVNIQVHAHPYDEKGDEIFDDLNYSLDTEYAGISIDDSTGILTITDQADAGTVIIHGIYENLDQTVSLELKKGTLPGFRTRVAAGRHNSFYISKDKRAWGWGKGNVGEFGVDDIYIAYDPIEVPVTDMVMISSNSGHTLGLKGNGTVWSWGVNFYGEIGVKGAKQNTRYTPTNLPSLNGTVKISAGEYHSLALKEDLTVWSWGRNENGRLGTGDTVNSNVPIHISSLNGIVDIAAGKKHSLALKEDGTVWSWGCNNDGQLGAGASPDRMVPVKVVGLTDVIAISAGARHSVALKKDGTVWVWGNESPFENGPYDKEGSAIPLQLDGLSDITAISAGDLHGLALKKDGTVWSWGFNPVGQLGAGTMGLKRSGPLQVVGLSNVETITAGDQHNLALKNNGEVWAWGFNYDSQLGGGIKEMDSILPVRCIVLSELEEAVQPSYVKFQKNEYETFIPKAGDMSVAVTANVYGDDHSLMTAEINYSLDSEYAGVSLNSSTGAVTITDKAIAGTVVIHAKYGDLIGSANLVLKKAIPPISEQRIEAGNERAFYIKEDQSLQGWGSGVYGDLGIDLSAAQFEAMKIPITSTTMVSAKGNHVLALKDNGTVWSWGSNGHGELGLDHLSDSNVPTNIPGLKQIVKVVTGESHSLVLTNDGNLWSWGGNQYGQLGTGSTIDSSSPISLSSLNGIIDIAASGNHSAALQEDGTVWTWGNLGNQLTASMAPVKVEKLTGVIAITAGPSHVLALKSDGTVWAWGNNDDRQLGNGTTAANISPVQVKGLANVATISAGTNHSLALKKDGTVWAWGSNRYGQLGSGTNDENWNVVRCEGLTGIAAISAGHHFSLALSDQETIWAWGNNEQGQLGDGTDHHSPTPIESQTDLEIAFVDRTYTVDIPETGIAKINVKAQVFHGKNEIIAGREIAYGLESAYEGVSIDSTTGEVTIDASAKWGTAVLTASSGGLHCNVSLVLTSFNTITPLANTIHIDAVAGSTYDVSVYVKDVPRNSGMNIIIKYDQTIFEVMDLCRFTEKNELEAGQISEAGLHFTQVTPGEIRFVVNKDIPNGKFWSGIVNIIGLRAKASGTSEINISN